MGASRGAGILTDNLTRTPGPCRWKGSSANEQEEGDGEWAGRKLEPLQAMIFALLIFFAF